MGKIMKSNSKPNNLTDKNHKKFIMASMHLQDQMFKNKSEENTSLVLENIQNTEIKKE